MSLVDEIKAEREKLLNPQFDCKVCAWIDTQDPGLREEMEDWVVGAELSRKGLYRLCSKNGLGVKETTFLRHVRMCILKEIDE